MSTEKIEADVSVVENANGSFDESSPEYRAMTKRVLWKFDLHILPPLALLWLANFIDRTNIGNAKIVGLQTGAHLSGTEFNSALAVFYVTYIASELPSNWVLKKFKPSRWIPFIVALWGMVTTLSGLVHNYGGLVAIRLMLGLCEGGLLPGMILYLSTIYKKHELQFRVGVFYASASLSGAFGGLLATAIVKMDGVGGLAGWKWIFILEGIATVICAIIAAIFLPADIAHAKFLTPEEREFALRRFHLDDAVSRRVPVQGSGEKGDDASDEHNVTFVTPEEEQFEWGEVIRGCVDIQVWLTGLGYFGFIVSLYSFSVFLPTIVSGLGFSGEAAQLHTVPPYVPAVVLTVVVAILSDRYKWRGPFILIILPLAIIGYIIIIVAKTNTLRYAAVFLIAAGIYPCGPCILSILPNNSSGHYKKATTTALQLMIANCGGFVATFAYTPDQAPRYIRGHSIVLAFVCLAWVLMAANVAYCAWENKARREGRRHSNVTEYQKLWNTGKTRAPIGDRSPDFMYTL